MHPHFTETWSECIKNLALRASGSPYKHRQALVLPVERTKEGAVQTFHAYQRENLLSPFNVLSQDAHKNVQLSFQPFWVFKITASATYSACVGHAAAGSDTLDWKMSAVGTVNRVTVDGKHPEMVVAASYSLRRSLLTGLIASVCEAFMSQAEEEGGKQATHGLFEDRKLPLDGPVLRQLASRSEVLMDSIVVEPVAMRQSIAWELALRAWRHEQVHFALYHLVRDQLFLLLPLHAHARARCAPSAHTLSQAGQRLQELLAHSL
jgi:hypothetical protein